MSSSPSPPWRILSLDGGGVRGLAELLILQRIFNTMQTIMFDELRIDHGSLKPSDFLDLIGGTSTGGLVALLLGRLKLSIPVAITTFQSLSRKIFPRRKGTWLAKQVSLVVARPIYDGAVLENGVQNMLKEKETNGNPEAKMIEEGDPACRVFVCATGIHTTNPILLRTYKSPDPGQANHSVRIWQAARATSAAPPFFDSVTIDECGLTLRDGAFKLNNPIDETLTEASTIDPDRGIGCIISIGTGVANLNSLESGWLLKIMRACVRISLDCDEVAANFARGRGRQFLAEGSYFRFNVPQGLRSVGTDEWEKHEAVQEYVEKYLGTMSRELDQCARKLLIASGYRVAPQSPQTYLRTPGLSPPQTAPSPPELALPPRSTNGATTSPWEWEPMDFDRLMPANRLSAGLGSRTLSETSSLSRLSRTGARSTVSLSSYPHLDQPASRSRSISSGGNLIDDTNGTNDTVETTYAGSLHTLAPSVRSTDSSLTNLPGLDEPSPSPADPAAAVAAITAGRQHLSQKQFDHAFNKFKQALKLLQSIPPTRTTRATNLATISAHLGVHDALIQAASAKKSSSPDKARAHLADAKNSMLRAWALARLVPDRLPFMQVNLAMVVIAIMNAELLLAVAETNGQEEGQQQGRRILPEHASSLMGKILELQEKLSAEIRLVPPDEGLEQWLVLQRKVEAWRRRVDVRHCGLAELDSR
ncbi:acyl transferase/acyl hydrolase/lysophospholipase [Rhypophila decipiens]|uniref:Acyl transferase/acyl hydrolase/lysophospholipase n=1 Tax=Rhypophila decipiens TaxID=261697 RepID=A0AAN6YBM3_9PEZI|nr:acyl transferase/acyl hydrolase/lysophospholipase [Rhypophila decipiens]